MKSIQLFFALILLALFNSSLYAKNYYVCNNGDDSWPGETKAKPFKTFDKAVSNFRYLRAGDSISFCRGGQFAVSDYKALFNTNFTAEKPLRIGDYYTSNSIGNESRPIITNLEAGIFYFNTRKTDIPDGGLIIENLILKGGGKSRGIFFLNGFSDTEIKNVLIDGFRVGASIGEGANKSTNIVLKDSEIKNNFEQGWLGGGDNLQLENNYFHNNGFGGKHNSYFYHNVYVSSGDNVTIRGNTLYQSAMSDGKCGGASLVVHGRLNHLLIENNTIKEDKGAVSQFCYGIGVGPAYNYDEAFYNVIVKNNNIINSGRVGFHGASLVNALIENNYIIDEGEVLDEGIVIQDKQSTAGDIESQNVSIIGNTIIANNAYAKGVVAGGDSPFLIELNIISTEKGGCFKIFKANTNTDISTNTCKQHAKLDRINNAIEYIKSRVGEDDSAKAQARIEAQARAEAQVRAEAQARVEAQARAQEQQQARVRSQLAIAESLARADAQARDEAQAIAEAQAIKKAQEAAAAAIVEAQTQAQAAEALAIAQEAEEEERAQAEATAQAQAQVALKAATQAKLAADKQERAEKTLAKAKADALEAKKRVNKSNGQSQNAKSDNLDPVVLEAESQDPIIALGSSGSGSKTGWSTGASTTPTGSGGWSGTKNNTVTYADVLYAKDNTPSETGTDNSDCRATSADGQCLLR